MSEIHNIDDVLVSSMANELVQQQVESIPDQENIQPDNQPEDKQKKEEDNKQVDDPYLSSEPEKKPKEEKSNIDEYGNPLEKTKMYTQDEVNQLMRDRAARERYRNENHIQKHQETPKEEPETEEDWRRALKSEIKRGVEEVKQEEQERLWREEQGRKQAEFEDKFTRGMEKYKDFREVIADKPITDRMLLATRSLDNPAAFVYAAAKLHSQELDRISRIDDPYIQAAEVGRLHERMVRERKSASSTSKPLTPPSGDMPVKTSNMPSLEQRINEYGKSKRR